MTRPDMMTKEREELRNKALDATVLCCKLLGLDTTEVAGIGWGLVWGSYESELAAGRPDDAQRTLQMVHDLACDELHRRFFAGNVGDMGHAGGKQ